MPEKRRTLFKETSNADQDDIVTPNPNTQWTNYKGAWLTNFLVVCALKVLFTVIPGVTQEASWTLTNVVYNMITFLMFHWATGTPFEYCQGEYMGLTLWEQMDNGEQYTPNKKFFTAFPIFLFLLSTHYTHYNAFMFLINFVTLLVVLIGKLPVMHRIRLFGINKPETY